MGRRFSESDFQKRTFQESDFEDTQDAVSEEKPGIGSQVIDFLSKQTVGGVKLGPLAGGILQREGPEDEGFLDRVTRKFGELSPFAAAAVAAPVAGPITAGGLALGAGVGGGVELARQALRTGLGEQTIGAAVGETAKTTASIAAGTAATGAVFRAGSFLAKAGSRRTPEIFRQIFGTPLEATKRFVAKGGKITKEAADAGMELITKAQDAMVNAKRAAGRLVGRVEDRIIESSAPKLFDTGGVGKKLGNLLEQESFTGIFAGLRPEGIPKILTNLRKLLKSSQASGPQLIRIRRLLDEAVDFASGPLSDVPKGAQKVIKGMANEIRGTVNNGYPFMRVVNTNFKKVSEAVDKYKKFFGGNIKNPDLLNDVRVFDKVKRAFNKGGKAQELVSQFDEAIKGSDDVVSDLFDSITAQEFNLGAPSQLSPSSIGLRTLASAGLTSPRLGPALFRGGRAAAQAVGATARAGQPLIRTAAQLTAAQRLADAFRAKNP